MNLSGNVAAAVAAAWPGGMPATNASTAAAALAAIRVQPGQMPDDIQLSQMANLNNVAEMAVGEYTGTGSALDITLPFDPLFVVIIAQTAPIGVTFVTATTNTQSAAKAVNCQPTGTIATVVTQIGAQSAVCGTAGQKKFTVGTDASVNATSAKYAYVAFGI